MLLFSTMVAFSQITLSKEQLDSLPPAMKQAIEMSDQKRQVKEKIAAASEYASWGKEIGVAVDGALGAVENHVVKLSKTDLGHTIIFLVCWKFLAKDILGMVVGLSIFCVMIWMLWYHKKRITTEDFKNLPGDTQEVETVLHYLATAGLFIASMMAVFG